MFAGEFVHSLDAKGRLTIPARFREDLSDGMVITRGFEPCLVLYPLHEWALVADRAARLPTTSPTARAYNRLVFGGAAEVTIDKLGRVLVSAFLREYANLSSSVVVMGVNNYIEIWNPEQWKATFGSHIDNIDGILQDVTEMSR